MLLVACGSDGASVIDGSVDSPTTDATVTEIDAPVVPCGNGALDPGEQCDNGPANGGPGSCCTATCTSLADGDPCTGNGVSACSAADVCMSGVCQHNDVPAQTACSDEPTCNADACNATGTCSDVAAAPDLAACTERGGTNCCAARCSVIAQGGDCTTCVLRARGPQRITIIESQSINAGHNMDFRWRDVAMPLGHTVTVVPQATLDAIANLDNTDILIVSSGVLDLGAARVATIDAFAASGRGVYLQAEYQTTYATNQAFAQIVNAHGGTFTWSATVTGTQDPVTVNGCLANTAETQATLTAYWYAATGTGTAEGLHTIHTATGGQPIGWSFCLPDGGLVISNTDQDFVRDTNGNPTAHMRNVLLALADAENCLGAVPTPD